MSLPEIYKDEFETQSDAIQKRDELNSKEENKMKLASNEFKFLPDSRTTNGFCNELIVEVDTYESIKAASDESDCCFDESDVSIFDETTQEHIKLENLTKDEQTKLLEQAESVFNENIGSDWFEYQVGRAEAWSDSKEDR